MATNSRGDKLSWGNWWERNQQRIAPYVFISPFYVLFAIFWVTPTVSGLFLSFYQWSAFGPGRYIGLDNYLRIFSDKVFQAALVNTFWYMGTCVFLSLPLSLILAVILNSRLIRLKSIFRTIYVVPSITSTVAVALVFILFLDRDYGLLNFPLVALGLEPLNWLGSTSLSKPAILIMLMWHWLGLDSVYFLAGLQAISRELYEAAQLDGANRWQNFWYITIPLLRPIMIFIVALELIGIAQVFNEPYVLTKGGPSNSSLSIAYYIYRTGLERFDFGGAAAAGFIFFVLIFALAWTQMKSMGILKE